MGVIIKASEAKMESYSGPNGIKEPEPVMDPEEEAKRDPSGALRGTKGSQKWSKKAC